MTLKEHFPVGSKVTAYVHGMTPFGAFMSLGRNFRGLLHISKMQCTKKIKHPNQVVKKGDLVECYVLSVNEQKNRVELGANFTRELSASQ